MTGIQGASFRPQWRNLWTMLKDFSISLRFSRNDGDFLNLSLIAESKRLLQNLFLCFPGRTKTLIQIRCVYDDWC